MVDVVHKIVEDIFFGSVGKAQYTLRMVNHVCTYVRMYIRLK